MMRYLGSPITGTVALTTDDLGNNIVDGTKTKDALIGDYSDVTITASDLIMYGDATDSNNTKRDTVQGILDLAGGGKLLQIVHGSNASVSTHTTQLPNDNTKPQNNEGGEAVTVAITPANSSNKLFITSNIQMTKDSGTQAGYIALFQDSTADALAAAWATSDTANNGNSHTLTHVMTAGTTSSTTFKMRGGNTNSGTVTFNGESGGAKLNGTLFSTITIMEIEA